MIKRSEKILRNIIIVFLITLYFSFIQKSYANSPATPDPQTTIFPQVIINEISFKDSENDWVELYIINDMNNGDGSSINGLQIQDDSIFFTLEEESRNSNDFSAGFSDSKKGSSVSFRRLSTLLRKVSCPSSFYSSNA